MPKPSKEPFDTPMATRSKLARASGHKPTTPDPPGWETVTNPTDIASQIRKIMAWYTLDVRDNKVPSLESWKQFDDDYHHVYRANISVPGIQTKVLQTMYSLHFPYVRQGTWGKAMFWILQRSTYPPHQTPTSTSMTAETPPIQNYIPQDDYMIDTAHMTPLEDKLGDFIVTRSKTRNKKTPPPPMVLPHVPHHTTRKHQTITTTAVSEDTTNTTNPVRTTPPRHSTVMHSPDPHSETPDATSPTLADTIENTNSGPIITRPKDPPPHSPITAKPNCPTPATSDVFPLDPNTYSDDFDTLSNTDTDSINLPSVIAPVPAPAPPPTTYAAMVDRSHITSTQTLVQDMQRQLNQLQMVIQTQQLELANLRDSTQASIQSQVKTHVALLANSTDYREIVRTTFETWQTQLQSRADASKTRNKQIEMKYRDWTTKLHRQVTELDDQFDSQRDDLTKLMQDHRKQLSIHVVDAQLEAEQLRALVMNELQTSIVTAQTQFTSWVQVVRQKELDTVRQEFEEIRTDCFKQIDDEFELQTQHLRSDMDCLQAEVKHLTREGLATYRDTLLHHAHPPPATTIPCDDTSAPRPTDTSGPSNNTPVPPTPIPNDHPVIDLVTPPPPTRPVPHSSEFHPPPNPPFVPIPPRPPAWAPNVNMALFDTNPTSQPGTHHGQSTTRPQADTRASGEKYLDPEYQLTRLRKATPSMHLTGTTREEVHSFYNSFVDFLDSHRVPIRPLMALRTNEPAFPTDTILDPLLLQRYSAAIYTRLEEPGVLDTRISRYKGLLQQHNESRDGYMVLQQLLRPHIDHATMQNFATVPVFSPTDSIYTFAANITKFFTDQRRRYRHYGKREQALMYLQGILADTEYSDAAKSLLTDLAKLDPTYDDLDPKYHMDSLPGTVEAYRALTQPYSTTHTRINAASTRAPHRDTRPRHRHPIPSQRSTNPQHGQPNPRHTSTTTRLDAQCEACGMYGHQDPSSCTFLPRVALCMEYLETHSKATKGITQAWKHRNNPKVKNLMKDQMIKQLQVHLADRTHHEIAEIATSILDDTDLPPDYWHDSGSTSPPADAGLQYNEAHYRYATAPDHTDQQGYDVPDSTSTYQYRLYCTPANTQPLGLSTHLHPSASYYRDDIQPVQFPPVQFLQHPFILAPEIPHATTPIPTNHTDPTPAAATVLVKKLLRIDPRVHQLADTGANFSVTDDPGYLHDYTTDTKFETTGYDGVTRKATGHGIMKIINNFGNLEQHTVIHSAETDGTIISVEHLAKSNPTIHRWEQSSIPSEHRGWITFYRKDDTIVSQLTTIRHNGLYYVTNLRIIPPPVSGHCSKISSTSTIDTGNPHSPDIAPTSPFDTSLDNSSTSTAANPHTATTTVPPTQSSTMSPPYDCDDSGTVPTDFTISLESEYIPTLLTKEQPTHHHSLMNVATYTVQAQATTTLEKDLINYEIWHQRLGHVSEHKLRKTQQCAHGIPAFTHTTLPSMVRCRICDIARLQKAPRGPPQTDPPDLKPGQMFHIDIGFFRGPANLADVVDRKAEPMMKVVESRQGYVCYLLIIDRKTRKVWIFPLKSRAVPMTLITTFLRMHGNQEPQLPRWIRTDGEGALAHSAVFRSDILTNFGYIVELTATDASSQNALAERPHKTFGLMVRCLLYSSRLPVLFWADAYVYANYIYDRLHHTAIGKTPYEAWTMTKPSLHHLRAFGAHVTVKRSGHRPTKADPHYYDGYFLRFAATTKNIIYWDPTTKREKLARHCVLDEFHFGSPPEERPPGAHQVIQSIFPTASTESTLPTPMLVADAVQHDPSTMHEDILTRDQRFPTTPQSTTLMQITTPPRINTHFAKMHPHQQTLEAIIHLESSGTIYTQPTRIALPLNRLPTLGLRLIDDPQLHHPVLHSCQEGTAASRIPRWRSRIRFALLYSLQGQKMSTRQAVIDHLSTIRQQHPSPNTQVDLVFVRLDTTCMDNTGVPQLHFDQLHHIHAIRTDTPSPIPHLTRRRIQQLPDFPAWQASEYAQHDKYKAQGMFGDPMLRPLGAIVLPFVWTYLYKDGKPKARATCNGGARYGKAVTMAETYANCVEQPACRLFWSLAACYGYIVLGADAGNAFAEAPPPDQPFYMLIDEPYRAWWSTHLQRPPIPSGYVLPVNHALQGHPEAPRLWEKHITSILTTKLGFTPTTHEPCLYVQGTGNDKILFLRQVDDFAVAASSPAKARQVITDIGTHLIVPLNDLGIIQKFNGVNITQSRHFIHISCKDYLTKILQSHNWTDLPAANKPIPMRSNSTYQSTLETAGRPTTPAAQQLCQDSAGFSYRAAIGELIYALITARPDISFCTTKLSQYSENPASCHYVAVKHVFAYLNHTVTQGLVYWRRTARPDLPDSALPQPISNPIHRTIPYHVPLDTVIAYTDSDWGSDRAHRRSVPGTLLMLAGATILYKTRYQQAVALSSTEAEFVAASDTGKSILYIRSLLHDLDYPQSNPTQLLIDNRGAFHMVHSQAPTKRTRHVDIRYFALLQWQQLDYIKVIPVPTDHNISDSMTKATGRTKFHQHADLYLGRSDPRSPILRVQHFIAPDHSSTPPTLHSSIPDVDSTGG